MTLLPPRNILGFEIPSDSPVFLTVLSCHVLAALGSVATGIIAMLSPKRSGRHPGFGTIYYWCLAVVFLSATVLAAMRWSDDAYLFFWEQLPFQQQPSDGPPDADDGAGGCPFISPAWDCPTP